MWIPLFLRIFSVSVLWSPDFSNLQGNKNWFEKLRVQEIGIPLYYCVTQFQLWKICHGVFYIDVVFHIQPSI